eukprot:6637604-Karenia_brevis.AAC.1
MSRHQIPCNHASTPTCGSLGCSTTCNKHKRVVAMLQNVLPKAQLRTIRKIAMSGQIARAVPRK